MQQHVPLNHMIVRGLAGFRLDPMGNCVIVTVVGEVDLDSAVGLAQALKAAAVISPCLVIDMTGLEFMDSTGLGTLLGARRRMLESGSGMVAVVSPPQTVRRLLSGTALQQTFDVYESLAEALGAVTAAAKQTPSPSA
jgi:anti-sigma B factor antagonist